ncbi:MAG: biopolymer transporter ExbB [Candidatus Poribacteria bacterium]|nr:MAG: biopolymer transporter ExbB [Candidatus Poribacteria bacterium]
MEVLSELIQGLEQLSKGGPMLAPLLFFSLICTAIFLERVVALRRDRLIPADYLSRVYRLLEQGKYDTAVELCERRPMVMTGLIRLGIRRRQLGPVELMRELREYLSRETYGLYRNLYFLRMVAALAPLLGLLGTVWGMIRAFGALSSDAGEAQLKIVADGISVALLTTFAGLVIAVPTYVAHEYLQERAATVVREMHRYALALVRFLKAQDVLLKEMDTAELRERIRFDWEEEASG